LHLKEYINDARSHERQIPVCLSAQEHTHIPWCYIYGFIGTRKPTLSSNGSVSIPS